MTMKPNITIGICTGGTVRTETLVDLVGTLYNLGFNGIQPNLLAQIGGYVDVNRNQIVDSAIKNNSTHIMFIDNDMKFPDDGVARLLKHDKDIVAANYNVRLDPTSGVLSGPTVKMLVDGKPVSMLTKDFPTELFKCYAVATGFTLIKTDVFKKLEKPYFEAWQDDKGIHYTEDIDFCRKAGEAGIEVWCDPTIKLGHIGSYTY